MEDSFKLCAEKLTRLKVIRDEYKSITEKYNEYLLEIFPNREYEFYSALRKKKNNNLATLDHIKEFCDFYFNFDVATKNRKAPVVEARVMASYLMLTLTNSKLTQMAIKLGYKITDHSAMIHNKNKFEGLYYSDGNFRSRFLLLIDKLEDFGVNTEALHEKIASLSIAK